MYLRFHFDWYGFKRSIVVSSVLTEGMGVTGNFMDDAVVSKGVWEIIFVSGRFQLMIVFPFGR
jgi:hypothetical protein